MSSRKNVDKESARLANFTEAVNQLLLAVHCPPNHHLFLHTLIGYADGRIDVSVFDAELGSRQKQGRSAEAAAKWVQRNRRDLNKWQVEHDIYLVESKGGFKDKDNKPVPSRYHIHLTNYVNSILEEAKKDLPRWDVSPHTAIEFAARRFVKGIFTKPQFFNPTQAKTKDVAKDIGARLSSCITHLEKISDLADANSNEITKEHLQLWETLKLAVGQLRIYFEEEDEEDSYEEEEADDEDDISYENPVWDTE